MSYVLLFIGGQNTMPEFILQSLCTCATAIICADSGFDILYNHHITPTTIIGDFDSTVYKHHIHTHLAKHMLVKQTQELTDTEYAIMHITATYPTYPIFIIGGEYGRIDHAFTLFQQLPQWPAVHAWCNNDFECIHLHGTRTISIPLHTIVSIFSIAPHTYIRTSGLKWNITELYAHKPSISNCLNAHELHITMPKDNHALLLIDYTENQQSYHNRFIRSLLPCIQ